MVYSDVSGGNGIVQEVKFLTGSPADFLAEDINRSVNNAYLELQAIILKSLGKMDLNETSVLVDLAGVRTINWPTGLLKIKRVEMTFDSGAHWVIVDPIDEREIDRARLASEAEIAGAFTDTSPRFLAHNNSIEILSHSIPTYVGGLRVSFEKILDRLTDNADEPQIPENFQPIIGWDAAMTWAIKHDKFTLAGSLRAKTGTYDPNTGRWSGMKGELQAFFSSRVDTKKPQVGPRAERYD